MTESMTEEARDVIDERIERRRQEKDFQERLRTIVEQDRAILDRLATKRPRHGQDDDRPSR
jgi:hypothetical protein